MFLLQLNTIDNIQYRNEWWFTIITDLPFVRFVLCAPQEVGALSGGEKSYSGLMLLTAITQAAEGTPFHMVDEFDVYQVRCPGIKGNNCFAWRLASSRCSRLVSSHSFVRLCALLCFANRRTRRTAC